jgi:hypothetical protein
VAVTCTHCATVNPDGNTICMSCGMPLGPVPVDAAASNPSASAPDLPGVALPVLDEPLAVPAGTSSSPPVQASPTNETNYLPPGYVPGASPYLAAPASGAAPLHRTGGLSVIAIVGVISIVFGGAGAIAAAVRTGATTPPSGVAAPANVPPNTGSGGSTTQTSTNGGITTTPFAKVFVPPGFSINDQGSDYIVLTPDNDDNGAVGLQSEPLTSTKTNAELDQDLLAGDQQNGDPSAKFCTTKAPTHTQLIGSGGAITADVISICENVTPTGGPAYAAVDGFIDAVATTSTGSLEAIWVEIFAPTNDYQSFSNSVPSTLFTQTTFSNAAPTT